jgi:hypothetical protein
MGPNDLGLLEVVPSAFSPTTSSRSGEPSKSAKTKLCAFARISLQRSLAIVHGSDTPATTPATVMEMEARFLRGNGNHRLDELCKPTYAGRNFSLRST